MDKVVDTMKVISPAVNLLSPAADAVRTVVGVPIHLTDTVIEKVVDCITTSSSRDKQKEEPNGVVLGDSLYDVADPMLDLSTLIYPYSFLRRAFSKQIKELLTQLDLTEEQVKPLKVALALMRTRLDHLNETGEGASEYTKSVDEVNELKKRLGLQGGDIEIIKKYYAVMAPGKTVSEIKADLTVYADTIASQLFLFGSEEFNLESAQSLVKDDANAVFTYIDDDCNLSGGLGLNTEVVYAIVKSDKQKKITVVFRGSVTGNDWIQNVQATACDLKLPGYTTEANEVNRVSFGKAHFGFYDYLFGDTMTGNDGRTISKSEEIMGRVTNLLFENPDYEVFFTGHSLGGALSTLMSFRAAAFDNEIKGTVTNVSFASPFAGDQEFRDKFYELEMKNKIKHLRVSNEDDVVPLIPFVALNIPPLTYKHTGVNVRLFNKSLITPAYKVSYPKKGSLLNEVRNAVNSNVLLGATIKSINNHLCPEYRQRLDAAKDEGLSKKTLDELYADSNLTGWTFPPETELPPPTKPYRQASFVSEF